MFIMYVLTGEKSTTSGAFRSYQIPNIDIPVIKDIPIIGKIISGPVGHSLHEEGDEAQRRAKL